MIYKAKISNVLSTTTLLFIGLISWVVNGYNATVFAYGATGCGKTYTMLGNEDSPGIMARTLNDLFLEMNKNADNRYQVWRTTFAPSEGNLE